MKRFSVMVTEYGAEKEVELCQIDSNPQHTVAGLEEKTLMVRKNGNLRRTRMPKYSNIRVIDHQAAE